MAKAIGHLREAFTEIQDLDQLDEQDKVVLLLIMMRDNLSLDGAKRILLNYDEDSEVFRFLADNWKSDKGDTSNDTGPANDWKAKG
jgi:hypothetical protein